MHRTEDKINKVKHSQWPTYVYLHVNLISNVKGLDLFSLHYTFSKISKNRGSLFLKIRSFTQFRESYRIVSWVYRCIPNCWQIIVTILYYRYLVVVWKRRYSSSAVNIRSCVTAKLLQILHSIYKSDAGWDEHIKLRPDINNPLTHTCTHHETYQQLARMTERHINKNNKHSLPTVTYPPTHAHHFLLSAPPFQYVSVCHQREALSHNDRPLWKALLLGLSVCHGLALSEMDVPLIELFHSNCFHLLVHKHFKSPSPPLNHNPISPIFPRIAHQSCLLPKSFLPFIPDSYFFTWHFSVTRYYRNDTRKCVMAIVTAPWLSPLRFLTLLSFKAGMVRI